MRGPDFGSIPSVAEIVIAHNEMCLTARDLGIKSNDVETFADKEAGVRACERLFSEIMEARQAVRNKEKSRVAKRTTKKKVVAKKPVKRAAASKKTPTKTAKTIEILGSSVIKWLGRKIPVNVHNPQLGRIERVKDFDGRSVDEFLQAGGMRRTLSNCWKIRKLISIKPAAA